MNGKIKIAVVGLLLMDTTWPPHSFMLIFKAENQQREWELRALLDIDLQKYRLVSRDDTATMPLGTSTAVAEPWVYCIHLDFDEVWVGSIVIYNCQKPY